MKPGVSDRLHRQVYRLFSIGAVGTMSDAQLLDRFLSHRDEEAEAAFEELMVRHGPMVLPFARASFVTPTTRKTPFKPSSSSWPTGPRRSGASASVASWLFGVAHRVATRARQSAARRHSLEQNVARQSPESYVEHNHDPSAEILHEEIGALPERLRTPWCCVASRGLPTRRRHESSGSRPRQSAGDWPACESGCAAGLRTAA